MVIMAGTVFWLIRAGLALVPSIALSYPIRKWAAGAALAAALFYLLLSGAAVPTVRSWIMMSIVLIAVLLDRPALTMRNVALAALLILIVSPESLSILASRCPSPPWSGSSLSSRQTAGANTMVWRM